MNLTTLAINPNFHGWRLVGFSAFSQFIAMGFSIYILGIYIAPLAETFAVSPGKLGWGMGIFYLINSIAGPFVGAYIDRGHARQVMTLGALLFAGGFIGIGLAPNLWWVALACTLLLAPGACMLGVLPCAAILVRWFRRRQSFALGLSAIGVSLGGFVMPPVANTLIELFGWRMSLVALGSFIAISLTPLAWFMCVGKPEDINQFPDGEAPSADNPPSEQPPAMGNLQLIRQARFWFITGTVGFLSLCSILLVTFIVPYARSIGLSSSLSALLISLYAGSAIVGKFTLGWLGDRWSKRQVMIAIQTIACIGWLFLLLNASAPALVLACTLVGFAIGGLTPIWASLLALHFGPAAFGQVKGIMTLAMLFFLVAPGPLGGFFYDQYGSYEAGFKFVFWLLPFGLLCAVLLKEKPIG